MLFVDVHHVPEEVTDSGPNQPRQVAPGLPAFLTSSTDRRTGPRSHRTFPTVLQTRVSEQIKT